MIIYNNKAIFNIENKIKIYRMYVLFKVNKINNNNKLMNKIKNQNIKEIYL